MASGNLRKMSFRCTICFEENVVPCEVTNSKLLDMYKKLTNTKFNSDTAKPRVLCCYCYQRLLRCQTFSEMALRSENISSHLYDEGLEITHESMEVNQNRTPVLSVSTKLFVVIDGYATNAVSQGTVTDGPIIDLTEEKKYRDQGTITDEPTIDVTEEKKYRDQGTITDEPTIDVTEEKKYRDQGTVTDEASMDVTKEDYSEPENETALLLPYMEMTFKPDGPFNNQDKQLSSTVIKKEVIPKVNKSRLIRHNKTKSHKKRGVKPHTCIECNKKFKQKCKLVIHMKTHTGEKLFPCDVCSKQFRHKSSLVRHTRTHTGE